MTEDERLERINRAFSYVPLNQYDEVTKLAELALGEFIRERDSLADTLREIASGQTVLATPGVLDESFSGRTAQEYKRLARAALDRQEQT